MIIADEELNDIDPEIFENVQTIVQHRIDAQNNRLQDMQ